MRRVDRPIVFTLFIASTLLTWHPTVSGVGGPAQALAIAASSPRDLRDWDALVTQEARDGDLRLRVVRDDTLMPGRSHERFDEYFKGVHVVGGGVTRQDDGAVPVSVFGQTYTGIDLDPTPQVPAETALQTVARSGPSDLLIDGRNQPELVILPLDEGGFALAYEVHSRTGTDRLVDFVDARTGRLILHYSNVQRQRAIGSGQGVFGDMKKVSARALSGIFVAEDVARPPDIATFDMRGNLARTLGYLNGVLALNVNDLASSTNNTWTDAPDVDGHVYAGYTYDYFYKRFGRRGLDNHDMPFTVLIHPVRRSDFATASTDTIDTFYLNAFYAGDGVVVYGEGLPTGFTSAPFRQTVNFFSGGLDIVAHELSHGVTEFSSGLIYRNESGALNEAFSDIMGISARFFLRPTGDSVLQANYGLGSDVVRPGGIRAFDNPGKFGDPDHYSKRILTAEDNGGLHTNCTIVDHAFYLAIEGGTNRTSGLSVQGVGAANRDQIEKIFYRGFTLMLTPNATFSMARAATIQSARDLYGSGSAAEQAVTQAWTAVGVN
jgi:Zn-dependent metalloprotease